MDISGSVNVSEILGTLDGTQKAIVMKEALAIIRDKSDDTAGRLITFINVCRTMTPIQQSAVEALLKEVRKRREKLLDELMKAVEDTMLRGTDFCQKIGRVDNA